MKKSNHIPYGKVFKKFDNHFNIEHNSNILFSGKYGIGKTTFLNEYCKLREDVDLVTIKLFPVNYVVSSNDNIFELIKIDIIKQLYLLKHIKLKDDLTLSTLQTAVSYAINKPLSLAKHLSKALSKLHPLGEVVSAASIGIYDLIKEFSEYEDELNKEIKFDDNKLLEYVEEKSNEIGSYVEYNLISELISNVILRLSKKKKVVLLVDDLDRLDPEHIFRLLNIFSSHHDLDNNQHKFGFNKVILVCHLENIESIFHHKYGEKTDFHGYIDKFYSEEIFEFDNNDAIDFYLSNLETNLPEHTVNIFRFLLRSFIKRDGLSIRQLIKHRKIEKIESFRLCEVKVPLEISNIPQFNNVNNIWFSSDDISIIYLIKYFSVLFGSYSNFKTKLESLGGNSGLFNKEMILSSVKSFALIDRYLESGENKLSIFFNSYGLIDQNGMYRRPNFDYPTERRYNVQIKYVAKWNSNIKYDSSRSYFEEFTIEPRSDFDDADFTIDLFHKKFKTLLSLVENGNLKQKLNIVS